MPNHRISIMLMFWRRQYHFNVATFLRIWASDLKARYRNKWNFAAAPITLMMPKQKAKEELLAKFATLNFHQDS